MVDLKNDLTSAESWYAFASAAMTSALIGSTGSLVSKHQKNKLLNAYAKDNGITFKEAKSQFEAVAKARTEIDNPTNFKEQMEMQSQNELALRKEMQSLKKDGVDVNLEQSLELTNDANYKIERVKQNNGLTTNILNELSNNNIDIQKETTIDLAKTLEKVSKDRNIDIKFDANLKSDGIHYVEDGKRGIVLNPNSNRALEFTLIHELAHDLELDTDTYNELKTIIKGYNDGQVDFESFKAELLKTYTEFYKKNNYDLEKLNIDNEATNDVLGQLLGDQNFINKLSVEKPNIFQNIRKWISNKLELLKSSNKENTKFLQELRDKFEDAYRKIGNANENLEQYLIQNVKGNYVKSDRKVIKGNDPNLWGEQVENYINQTIREGKDVDILTENGEILRITKDTAGKAKFRNYYIDTNGNKIELNGKEYFVKLLAEVHVDELAKISKKHNKKPVPDYKNHKFAKDGFDYRNAFFKDLDGIYYKITMSVGKNGDIGTIYNVGQLTQRKKPQINGSSVKNNGAVETFSNRNLPLKYKNVNKEVNKTSFSLSENDVKQKQLDIILEKNPMLNEYHQGIRTIEDIKTWDEVLELDDDSEGQFAWGDYTREDAEIALKNNEITIYSSYPIKNGTFVSTSYIQAEEYAGGRGKKVYSKTIPLNEVAWINGDEGQYVKVKADNYSLPTKSKWQEYLDTKLPSVDKKTTILKENVKKLPIKKEVNLPTKSKIDTNQIKQTQEATNKDVGQGIFKNHELKFDNIDEDGNVLTQAQQRKRVIKKLGDKTDEETKTSITTDYINKLSLSDRQKNIFVNSEINRKNEIDMSKYNDYGSLEEYDYATKNPTRYLTISQAMDYKDFDKYKNELNDIKKNSTDKDRKKKVFDYIEGLPLNSYEKLILHKMGAGYSIKTIHLRFR